MKYLILVLTTTLLLAGTMLADNGLQVRYLNPSGSLSLSVNHDIDVGDRKSIASRAFSFDLTMAGDSANGVVTVTIDKARATYTAHDMQQKLGTRHLPTQSFVLSIVGEGRQLELAANSDAPLINLGGMPATGYSVATQLVNALPVLPQAEVTVGSEWSTTREIRSLECWVWGEGQLTSRHRVTAVDHKNGRTIVSVKTEANGSLHSAEGAEAFNAELKRTVDWTFDVDSGQILSMSLEQQADGTCVIPQGELPFQQRTTLELAPSV